MTLNQSFLPVTAAALALVALAVAGCRVRDHRAPNGENKNVQVDTPFGGLRVNTDQTSAGDLGLAIYPGANQIKDDNNNTSADVRLGLGPWQLRVRTVSYESADSEQKVADFYQKALGRYGDVLTCRDHQPVGELKQTSEGLSCSDSEEKGAHFEISGQGATHKDSDGLELKAGSRRHQHIVVFEKSPAGHTRFTLVGLDLPSSGDTKGD